MSRLRRINSENKRRLRLLVVQTGIKPACVTVMYPEMYTSLFVCELYIVLLCVCVWVRCVVFFFSLFASDIFLFFFFLVKVEPQLLTESTSDWSPIKLSRAAGTACNGFALRLPVTAHQEITVQLLSPCVLNTHCSYFTICKMLHQCCAYLNTEPQIIFGISNTEIQTRLLGAADPSAALAAAYFNVQIMPDAWAIWEANFIICFF